MAAIATLKALLSLDNKAFKAGMRESTGLTKGFQSAMSQVGRTLGVAFSAAAIVAGAKSIADWASNLSTAAENAGIATNVMMAFNRVAIQSGLELGDVSRMLAKVANTTASAARGEEEYAKKLRNVGLNYQEMIKLNPAEQLQAVARAAVASGTPLESLAEIFEERLGPRAVKMLKDIAKNGLPAVDEAAGRTADRIEVLTSKWAAMWDIVKTGAIDAAGRFNELTEDAGAFWGRFAYLQKKSGLNALNPMQIGRNVGLAGQAVGESEAKRKAESDKRKADEIKAEEDKKAALKRVADQTRAKDIAAIDAETQAIADKKLSGLQKLAAEQEAIELKLAQRIAETQDQSVRQALWRQLEASRNANAQRVQDYKNSVAEEERAARESGAEKMRALNEQYAQRIAGTTGEGINVDSMARMGGFTGASRSGMASSDRKSKLAELQTEYQKETAAATREMNERLSKIEEKLSPGYTGSGV